MQIQNVREPITKDTRIALVATSDKDLDKLSTISAAYQMKDSLTPALNNAAVIAVPTLHTTIGAAKTAGTLATKAAKGGAIASHWGVIYGTLVLYNKAQKALDKHFPSLKQFKQDHPVISSIVGLTLIFKAMDITLYAWDKTLKTGKEFINKNKAKTLKSTIDKSAVGKFFNKTVIPKAAELVQKHPKIFNAKVGRGLVLATNIAIIALFLKNIADVVSFQNKKKQAYNELKEMQQNATISLLSEATQKEEA